MKYQIDPLMIKSYIKKDCAKCNVEQKIKLNNQCEECNFKFGRDGAYFSKNGIIISKSHLFYFLYHPELNFTFPNIPEKDFLGGKKEDRTCWRWELHHEDGNHWNDSEWNLLLVLKSEHMHLHHKGKPKSEEIKNSLKTGAPKTEQRIKRQLQTRRKNKTIDVGFIKTKLTKNQVIDIKKRLRNGESTTRLAEEYGRGISTIDNIKHGNSWKHIKI